MCLKGTAHLVTHDSRLIPYPEPFFRVNETTQIDSGPGKITDFIKVDPGHLGVVTGGALLGRIGVTTA